jgi:GT2 family glycosyltransferase
VDVTFIILTWNSEKFIHKCLKTLIASLQATNLEFEVFVVDNGSKDNTVNLINEFYSQYPDSINPIFLEKNTGTTYSRNLALKQAKGKYICCLDSDMEVNPGVIQKLIKTLQSNQQIGLVVPKLVYPTGQLQKSTDIFPTVFNKIYRYFFLKRIEFNEHRKSRSLIQITEPFEVDYAISAMWVFKRELLDKIGLLDEKIFYAPEDVDYCLRIWKAGYKILYDPSVSCIHHCQEISRGFKFNQATINHIKGLLYYFKKHRYFFVNPKYALKQ